MEVTGAERVFFAGRLGTYTYLDMDEAVRQALELFERKLLPLARRSPVRMPRATPQPKA